MARTKLNIGIIYAGRNLAGNAWFADTEGAFTFSDAYTTEAVPKLGAPNVELDESGNTESATSLSLAVDYESEAEMLMDCMERRAFMNEHKRGLLRYVLEGTGNNARCAITPLEAFISPSFGLVVRRENGEAVGSFNVGGVDGAAALVAALNDLSNWGVGPGQPMVTPLVHAGLDADTGKVVMEVVDPAWAGEAGNALYIDAGAPGTELPFTDETPVEFSGGVNETEYSFYAGSTGFSCRSTASGAKPRMIYNYEFAVGGSSVD